MNKIISIANQKGGVGKTTTAVNLAASLGEIGQRVLIVDIDPQGNACSGLGIDKDNENLSIYEVLMQEIPIEKTILPTKFDNLDIVPVNINLAGAEVEMVTMDNREHLLKNAIASIRSQYDYVIIDCPPSLGLLTLNGLVAADTVLIPLQCEFYALEGMAHLLKTISIVQKGLNKNLQIEGVLLTMYDGRNNLSNQVMSEATGYFKDKVYRTVIPRNVRLGEAPSFGQPINVYDGQSSGAKSYLNLAREVIAKAS